MEQNIVQREVEEGGSEGEEVQRLLGIWGRVDLQDSSVKWWRHCPYCFWLTLGSIINILRFGFPANRMVDTYILHWAP